MELEFQPTAITVKFAEPTQYRRKRVDGDGAKMSAKFWVNVLVAPNIGG